MLYIVDVEEIGGSSVLFMAFTSGYSSFYPFLCHTSKAKHEAKMKQSRRDSDKHQALAFSLKLNYSCWGDERCITQWPWLINKPSRGQQVLAHCPSAHAQCISKYRSLCLSHAHICFNDSRWAWSDIPNSDHMNVTFSHAFIFQLQDFAEEGQ